jgi:oligoendopeptidase F
VEEADSAVCEFRGTLDDGAKQLAACLKFDEEFDRLGERIGVFAYLKAAEDQANSASQRMRGRVQNVASEAAQAASFIRPEILAIPAKKLKEFMTAKELAHYRLVLERIERYRPHTLADGEEKLLAMQSQMADASNHIFRQLNDADLNFGMVKDESGAEVELSHSSYSALLHSPNREVRKAAFHQYYGVFAAHENTLAATLNGSVQRDVYYAKARRYESSRAAALSTMYRRRCMTTSSLKCGGGCRRSTATSTCGGARCGSRRFITTTRMCRS